MSKKLQPAATLLLERTVDRGRTRLGGAGKQLRKGEGCAKGGVEEGMDVSVEVVNNNTVTRNECLTDVDCTSRLRVGIQ